MIVNFLDYKFITISVTCKRSATLRLLVEIVAGIIEAKLNRSKEIRENIITNEVARTLLGVYRRYVDNGSRFLSMRTKFAETVSAAILDLTRRPVIR